MQDNTLLTERKLINHRDSLSNQDPEKSLFISEYIKQQSALVKPIQKPKISIQKPVPVAPTSLSKNMKRKSALVGNFN